MTTIHVVGNLTNAPELRYTQSGKAVANLTVAENTGRDDQKRTHYHRVTAWGDLAENIANLDKGQRVVVIGRLEQRDWQDKDGNNRKDWDITADEVSPSLRFKPREAGGYSGAGPTVEAWNGDQGYTTSNAAHQASIGAAGGNDSEVPF